MEGDGPAGALACCSVCRTNGPRGGRLRLRVGGPRADSQHHKTPDPAPIPAVKALSGPRQPLPRATTPIDQRFPRWERATPAQRKLLTGMAKLQGDNAVEVGELANHLGKSRTSDLSVARQELIKKGLVYAPVRGLVAFTVPGMADFVLNQDS